LTYISSYCILKGFSPAFSFQILPILNAGSIFGRWLPGYYADKIGRYNAAIVTIVLTIVSVLGIWLPVGDTKAGIIVFALLFGFSSGSNISLTPVCISQLCPIENYGRYYATCFSIVSAGCLIGVPVAGRILDLNHGIYDGLIILVGVCYVGGGIGFIVARGMATGWKLKSKY
jgi:MFS family permease